MSVEEERARKMLLARAERVANLLVSIALVLGVLGLCLLVFTP